MKVLSIIFIAIVLLTSIIGVGAVAIRNTDADKSPCTLDSANIYRIVEATALDKEAKEYAHQNSAGHTMELNKNIVSEVVYIYS